MQRLTTWSCRFGTYLLCALLPTAIAQFNSGSDGSDGVFAPSVDVEIDLSRASSAAWNTASLVPGLGIYDAEKWVVVYKFTSVTIPAGVTVTFKTHPKGAPVVWLVQGDVLLEGRIILDGASGDALQDFPSPGPGGFCGGRRAAGAQGASGGFGPGGADHLSGTAGAGGGYATEGESAGGASGGSVYGNDHITPLIGGSGGSAGLQGAGGAGGGAILIAASGQIQIQTNALISARGGNGGQNDGGGGSGGAVRCMAQSITGAGQILATGGVSGDPGAGDGGQGRIRLEAISVDYSGAAVPAPQIGAPDYVLPPNSAPRLSLHALNGMQIPRDPRAGIDTPDLSTRNADLVTLTVEAWNVPVETTVVVCVKPESGEAGRYMSTPLTGSFAYSTAMVEVLLPKQRSEIYLEAHWPR